jgi:hypothetical protein
LRNSLLECAVGAAAGVADATAQYIAVLGQIPEEGERIRASMIDQAAKLMDAPDDLNAMLPCAERLLKFVPQRRGSSESSTVVA